MRWVVLAWMAGCATTEPRPNLLAGPIQKSTKETAVRLSFNDALSHPVQLGGQERVTVVVFLSRSSKDESGELVRRLDEDLLDRPVEMVSVVDLRRYSGGLVRTIANKRLKQSAEDARVHRRQRREQHGVDASDNFVDRWHLVGDFDGKLFETFRVEAEPDHPVAFIVARSGAVLGPYHDFDGVRGALNRQLAGDRRAATRSAGDRWGGGGVHEVPAHGGDRLAVGLE